MALSLPVEVSDFRELREKQLTYIDKSELLIDMMDMASVKALLVPRPRRFGKTLNLSMLRYYFERTSEDLSHLFADLAVWRAGDAYRAHFQRYPVIYMSFGDIESASLAECRVALHEKIRSLYGEHRGVLDSDTLSALERKDYQAILDGSARPVLYDQALGDLSRALHRATGERAIILIDDYDQPVRAGHVSGHARDILDLLSGFLAVGLKDNPHLERGVMTGVVSVTCASIFSGLNNLSVSTLL